MGLNQMNEHFNEAFETYFPETSKAPKAAMTFFDFFASRYMRLRPKVFRGRLLANERIVEYPVIFKWIKDKGRVLDIGCVSSRLPIQLASMGYDVHGLDTRPYHFTHPNFRFHQCDLFKWNTDGGFDTILLVSVIEHFGLGGYGDLVLPEADKQAVDFIAKWLKPDGQLLVSLPFGKAGVTPKHRVYDSARLNHVFGGFHWNRVEYFYRKDDHWIPGKPEDIEKIPSPGLPANGVAVLDLRLKT